MLRFAAPGADFALAGATRRLLLPSAGMSCSFVRNARHVSLARALHRRLYVNCEGRVFAVGGRIAHAKLELALARQDRCPTAAEAPSPSDLGIASCDGELGPQLLRSIRHALHRWRKELSVERQRTPAKRRVTTTLAREAVEVDRLAARLDTLRKWQAEIACGAEPSGAPYFLDPAAEESFQAAIENAQREHPLTPLIAWQARLVCWLSGDCAAKRFLSATTRLLNAYPKASRDEQVRRFEQAVIVWKQRSKQERIRNLLNELAQHIKRLAPDIVCKARLSARLRGRTFGDHCDILLQGCTKLLADAQRDRWHSIPAALAALAAADDSSTPLPMQCFREAAEKENFAQLLRTIAKLADQLGQPGYDALLAAIDRLSESLQEHEFDVLRPLLVKGASLSDVVWACEQALQRPLANSCLSVSAARRLSEAFAQRGFALSGGSLSLLVSGVRSKEDLQPIRTWLAWLGSVSPHAITPRMRKTLDAALWTRYLPSVQKREWFEQLAPCLAPARRARVSGDCQPLLERIASQQQVLRRTHALPKSLRKLLGVCERRQREREVLRTRQAAGALGRAALTRLQRLESDAGPALDTAKIRRAAEEAFLLLGIERILAATQELAKAACKTLLGGQFAIIEPERYWAFAQWMDAMSKSQKTCLHELITTYDRHGRDYKRHLTDNHAWLKEASAHGINLARWLAAEPHQQVIRRQPVEIPLAIDLHHILRMGDYFRTCLSLGDCNEMSVLANAYDANKQVVFMFAADDAGRRRPIARQLIAVSSNFKLLGYRCYVDSRWADVELRQQVIAATAAYCGRLAAQCGLELADEGSPQELGDHFWYDDGEIEWPAAARKAFAESSRPANQWLF